MKVQVGVEVGVDGGEHAGQCLDHLLSHLPSSPRRLVYTSSCKYIVYTVADPDQKKLNPDSTYKKCSDLVGALDVVVKFQLNKTLQIVEH